METLRNRALVIEGILSFLQCRHLKIALIWKIRSRTFQITCPKAMSTGMKIHCIEKEEKKKPRETT
jgi:hypothetical protein